MKTIQRILLATDLSGCSERAAETAACLAMQMRAAIDVVHVIDTMSVVDGSADLGYRAQCTIEMRQQARDETDRFVARHIAGVSRTVVHIRDGSPAVEIVQGAQQLGCDLIVIGTHGRSGLSQLLMGSVAEQVIRHSQMPVVTVCNHTR